VAINVLMTKLSANCEVGEYRHLL